MTTDSFVTMQEETDTGIRFIARGHINTINATALQYDLEEAISKGEKNIVLNMTQVDFLSSSGIRVVLKAYKTLEKSGGRFRIERPSENVRNVLGITALEGMLMK